jgi:isopenicillin-N N-acyltransferase-like protein
MFTAFGAATPNGNLLQLRALDWDVYANLQGHSTVHVRHPKEDGSWGHVFATLGWTGYLSGLTGMSSNGMAISQKYGDEIFGGDSRIGYPFNYLLRDIIQFDDTLDSAITRMSKTKRTCSIYIGVGDQKLKTGRLFQYSAEELNIWDDKNQWNTTKHPQLDNVVYQGVRTNCFYNRLKMFSSNGKLTALNTISDVIPYSHTGNNHVAVYDFENNYMYVSNAKPLEQETGPLNAFDRTFIRLDMTKLFAEQKQ